MPGTGNFVGEFMILFGTFGQFKLVTTIMVFGVVFASIYALWMMQQVYYGSAKSEKSTARFKWSRDIGFTDISLVISDIRFYPQPVLDTSKKCDGIAAQFVFYFVFNLKAIIRHDHNF